MADDKSYSFEYKGTIIPLKDVGNDSENATVNEFNSLISELNLKYSFANLFHLSEDEWKKYPISFHYKASSLSLKDFVKENHEISKELKLLDSINGLEKIHQLDIMDGSPKCDKETVAICTETFRLFQDVYNTFALARFSLLEGFRKLHLYSTLKWDSGGSGQYWIRTSYLNNAIIWYNSCFDILLQTLWIGKRYFIGVKPNNNQPSFVMADLYSKYEDIIKVPLTTRLKDKEMCIKNFVDDITYRCIRDKANQLKHRNGLRYKEFCDPNLMMFAFGDYNSRSTESSTNIEEVIAELISYHKAFVVLVDEVKNIVSIEFKNNYNIAI